MKKLYFTSLALIAISMSSFADVPFRALNQDEKALTFKVKIDGVVKEVTFESNKAAMFTIKGTATECVLITSCGEVAIKSGSSLVIKDGCVAKKGEPNK